MALFYVVGLVGDLELHLDIWLHSDDYSSYLLAADGCTVFLFPYVAFFHFAIFCFSNNFGLDFSDTLVQLC